MNKIIDVLKPKCDHCHMFKLETNVGVLFNGPNIEERHIKLSCSNMSICEMYKEFTEKEESD